MPFHIQPIREFLVRPALPASLSRMTELAYNILWSWEPLVRALFRRLDPALWRDCGDRKSTRLNSSHLVISYAVFCLKKKNNQQANGRRPQLTREVVLYCHTLIVYCEIGTYHTRIICDVGSVHRRNVSMLLSRSATRL